MRCNHCGYDNDMKVCVHCENEVPGDYFRCSGCHNLVLEEARSEWDEHFCQYCYLLGMEDD